MQQMVIDLDHKQQRPIAILDHGLSALVDTGAYIPVWVDDESILEEKMGAVLIKKDISFSGFGGMAKGNIYQVTIQVGALIYPNMHIMASSQWNTSFHLILSATMFQQLIYEIDDKNHKLNITLPDGESTVRNLRIRNQNGMIQVLCHSSESSIHNILIDSNE